MNIPADEIEHLHTVRDWVRYYVSQMNATKVFFGHGCLNALDEAVFIVQSLLHLPLQDINPFLDARVLPSEKQVLMKGLQDRTERRIPAPYITGTSILCGQAFQVDSRVLIPRSFIAELLEDGLTPWVNDPDEVTNVLDLCTGSGCLAILCALAFPEAEVDAVDLSEDALQVAQSNIVLHRLSDRVALYQSDLFRKLPAKRYDLIITNPPYVNESSMQQLPQEYLHEPRIALAGGSDGMDLIEHILNDAPRFLTAQGMLVIEIGNERIHFEERFPDLEPTWLETSAGHDQVLLLHREQLTHRLSHSNPA